jgi:hypothetical protein
MPSGFGNFRGPAGPTRPAEETNTPESSALADAFQQLAAAGQPYQYEPTTTFRPFVGQVPNQAGQLRHTARLRPIADASMGLLDEYIATGMPVERAQALTSMATARRLRQLGFIQEATEMYSSGLASLKASRDTDLARRQIQATYEKTVVDTENVGDTALVNEQEERAKLEAILAVEDLTDNDRRDISRRIGEVEASIAKRLTVTGRTPTDMLTDKTLMRQQMTDHIQDSLLLGRLDQTTALLDATDPSDVSRIAQLDAAFSGFLQGWFGFDLSLTQEENIQKIVNQRGSASLVAAKIRHSLTGAQMSSFEIQYLEPFLPAPGDALSVQKAKLNLIRRFIMSDINTRIRIMTDPSFSASRMNINNEVAGQQRSDAVSSARDALAGVNGG